MRAIRLGWWWALAVALLFGGPGWIESNSGWPITSSARIAPAAGFLGLGLGLMAGLLTGSGRPGRIHISHGRWDMETVRDSTRPGWALNGPISLTSSGDMDLTPDRYYLRWFRWGAWRIRVRVCLANRMGTTSTSGQVHPGGPPGVFRVHFYVRDKSSR